MKFIHITDTHLVEPGARLYGLDPAERLDLCLADVGRRHADAAFAIVTGDLAHAGHPKAYAALRERFARLPLKTHFLIGNHDDRRGFLEAFPDSPRDENGFVQYAFDTPIGRFVCLDTNEPGVSWGFMCDRRVEWLERTLAASRDRPVYLFMHHPPMPVGIRSMDRISLRQPERFASVVTACSNIRHLFFGHLHRPIGGSWRGIPLTTMRATSHQVALDLVGDAKVPGSHEPPAYAVVLAEAESTIVHFHDFLDSTNTFFL